MIRAAETGNTEAMRIMLDLGFPADTRGGAHASNHAGEPGLLVVHSSIIHEISDMLHGDHEAQLVEPGGVVAIHTSRDGLKSEAI